MACGIVPTPDAPHHAPPASLDTLPAPPTRAAYPSGVWTRQSSCRAPMKITGLPWAASMTRRTFVATSDRRASTPRKSVSRCAKAMYGPVIRSADSCGESGSPSISVSMLKSRMEYARPVYGCRASWVWSMRITSYTPAMIPCCLAKTWTCTTGSRSSNARVLAVRTKYRSEYHPSDMRGSNWKSDAG